MGYETEQQLAIPDQAILQRWHRLAQEGGLLTLEEDALGLAERDRQYQQFVDQMVTLISGMEIEKTISLLKIHLLGKKEN